MKSNTPALNSLYKFAKSLRYPLLIGVLALLAGLLTLAKDLKIVPAERTSPVAASNLSLPVATPASRPAIKVAPREVAPPLPLMQAAGPVAAYGFSETAGPTTADASGNANTGTMVGGVTRIPAGKFGNAMRFDGNTGVVRILDSPTWKVSGLTGYTISMWVKVNSAVGDYKAAIGKGAWPASDLLINKTGSTWQFRIRTTALTCGGTTAPVSYLTTVDGTYHHIALVMDTTKGNCQFYSDGVVIGTDEYVSGTTVFATGTGLNNLYIGGLEGGRQFLNADIDEVRLYTRALSLAELQAEMVTPVDGAPPPDTTPPVISGVTASSITTTTATVSWATNEASDTQIEYGTTTAYGQTTTLDPSITTAHSQGLTGLTPGTLYNYRVLSRDAAGNLATSANFTFTTASIADTIPPVISAVSSSGITATNATITWTTNEGATSQVEYGLTTAYGSTTTLSTTLTQSHSRTLSGLTANTMYHYRVLSRDAAGNLATSADFMFTTAAPPPDTTPPIISAVNSSGVTATSATISWTTNETSSTQVEYGTTTAYGSMTTLDTTLVLSHSQTLSGLTPGTLYNYRVLSRDAAGNLATSANFTFTTLAGPDTTPPVLSNIAAGSVTSTAAVVTWRTSELANSQVEYGTTTAYGSVTTLNTTMANSHSHSITGLTPNTLYHYRVRSRDAAGNLAISDNLTFNTQPELTSFQDALWVGGMNSATSMEFAPDGRLFVCEKSGAVRVIQNGQLLATPFFTASVNSDGERGLLGIAFDPNFATNQYVYIYYTATTPNVHNRVSRLTANGNVAVAGSHVALLDLPSATGVAHQGGAIHFGNDGKLYIAVGDHLQPENAQSLSFMFGKMLRINADGTIPTDNPFYAQTTGMFQAIYAIGFRNPFTFAVDPVTGKIFVNDVGNNNWEEINQLVAGANYGWPTCEGPQGTGTGTCTSTSFTYPIHAYSHSADAAITGGVFYRGSQYPSQYYGDYFFSDYTANWIRFLDTENQVQGVNNPSSLFRDSGPPLDLKVGPDGAIYYLSFSGRVSRITYASGNRPPTAAFTATPNAGTPPLVVNFNGSTSSDPDNDPLTYTWVFGDGTPNGSGATLSHTYTAAGVYTATLTVNDGRGGQHSATMQIRVGNPPVATILTPGDGSFYNAGDTIQYSGSGMDVDQGTLPASAFSWTIVFHHGTHTHPFLGPINGVTGGSFQTEQTHETATDVWYRIHLRVTDAQGLTHEVFRDIHPNIVTFTLASNTPGATLTLDGQPVVTPYTTSSVVGTQRSIGVPSPQTIGGTEHVFVSWSDGGAATHNITTPATATTYTASLRPAGPLSTNWLPPSLQVFQNFNLALPLSTTSVAGLEVLLNLKVMSLAAAPQITVELSWDGGISWTPAKSPPAPTTTEQMFILGSATDLWGRAGWTASELTNTNFRVRVTTVSTSPTRDFLLDVAGVRLTAQ